MLDFDMGKYAGFVWPAYAITAVVLGGMILDSLLRARRWKAEAQNATEREETAAGKRDGKAP